MQKTKFLSRAVSCVCAGAILVSSLIGINFLHTTASDVFPNHNLVCDFDTIQATSLGRNTALNDVSVVTGEDSPSPYGASLKWSRVTGASGSPEVQINFNASGIVTDTAIAFWMSVPESSGSQTFNVGLRDRYNTSVAEFYQLSSTGTIYTVDDDGNAGTITATNSSMSLAQGFSGWIIIPFDSFTRHTGYSLDNGKLDVGSITMLQLWYNNSSQSGPHYVDQIGFIPDAQTFIEFYKNNGEMPDTRDYTVIHDFETITTPVESSDSDLVYVDDVLGYGKAVKWTKKSTAAAGNLNVSVNGVSSAVSTGAVAFRFSVPSTASDLYMFFGVSDTKNPSVEEFWYLNGSTDKVYLAADNAGVAFEQTVENGTVCISAGFTGWVVIPFAALTQHSGYATDNGVLDVTNISRVQMWHTNTDNASYLVDELGLAEDVSGFLKSINALADSRNMELANDFDTTGGSVGKDNSNYDFDETVSPYGKAVHWYKSSSTAERFLYVNFDKTTRFNNSEALVFWMSVDSSVTATSKFNIGIFDTKNNVNELYYIKESAVEYYLINTSNKSAAKKTSENRMLSFDAGFTGWVIIPLENFDRNTGWGNDNGVMDRDNFSRIQIWCGGSLNDSYYFDEFGFTDTMKGFATSVGSSLAPFLGEDEGGGEGDGGTGGETPDEPTTPDPAETGCIYAFNTSSSSIEVFNAAVTVDATHAKSGKGIKWQKVGAAANTQIHLNFVSSDDISATESVAFWVDATEANSANKFNIGLLDSRNANSKGNELWILNGNTSVYYTVDGTTNEAVKKTSDNAMFDIPKGFKGWVVIPFDSFTLHSEYANDNGKIDVSNVNQIQVWYNNASVNAAYYLDEVTFAVTAEDFISQVNGWFDTDTRFFTIVNDFDKKKTDPTVANSSYEYVTGIYNTKTSVHWKDNGSTGSRQIIANFTQNSELLGSEALVFWMQVNGSETSNKFNVGIFDQETAGKELFYLSSTAVPYYTIDSTGKAELKMTNNRLIDLQSGFAGWIIVPLDSFDINPGWTVVNGKLNLDQATGIQIWIDGSTQPCDSYLDEFGFTTDMDKFAQSVGAANALPEYEDKGESGAIVATEEIKNISGDKRFWNRIMDFDYMSAGIIVEHAYYKFNTGISPYGTSFEYVTAADGAVPFLNVNFKKTDLIKNSNSVVFWLSVPEDADPTENKFNVGILDTRHENVGKDEMYYLSDKAQPVYLVTADGTTSEVYTKQNTIAIDAGFSGWVVIPYTSLVRHLGYAYDNGVIDSDYLTKIQIWYGNGSSVMKGAYHFDEFGFSDDYDRFIKSVGGKIVEDTRYFVKASDFDAISGSYYPSASTATLKKNLSPYGKALHWVLTDTGPGIDINISSNRENYKGTNALVFWVDVDDNSSETGASNMWIGITDTRNVTGAGNEFYYLKDGSNKVYTIAEDGTTGYSVSAARMLPLENGFRGWVVVPFDILEQHESAYAHDNNVLDPEYMSTIRFWTGKNNGPFVFDEIGFTDSMAKFMTSVGGDAEILDESDKTGLSWLRLQDFNLRPSGCARTAVNTAIGQTVVNAYSLTTESAHTKYSLKWSELDRVGGAYLNIYFSRCEAAKENVNAVVMWVDIAESNSTVVNMSPLLYDVRYENGNKKECWWLDEKPGIVYLVSDETKKLDTMITSNHNLIFDAGFKGWVIIPSTSIVQHTSWATDNGVLDYDYVTDLGFIINEGTVTGTYYFDDIGYVQDMKAFYESIGADTTEYHNSYVLNDFENDAIVQTKSDDWSVVYDSSSAKAEHTDEESAYDLSAHFTVSKKSDILIKNRYAEDTKVLEGHGAVSFWILNGKTKLDLQMTLVTDAAEYTASGKDPARNYYIVVDEITGETQSYAMGKNGNITVPANFRGYIVVTTSSFDIYEGDVALQMPKLDYVKLSVGKGDFYLDNLSSAKSTTLYVTEDLNCYPDKNVLFAANNNVTIKGFDIIINNKNMSYTDLRNSLIVRYGYRMHFNDKLGYFINSTAAGIEDISHVNVYVGGTKIAEYNIKFTAKDASAKKNAASFPVVPVAVGGGALLVVITGAAVLLILLKKRKKAN